MMDPLQTHHETCLDYKLEMYKLKLNFYTNNYSNNNQ